MRPAVSVTCVALLCGVASHGWTREGITASGAKPETIEREIIEVDARFDDARRAGDKATIADMVTDDFILTGGAGQIRDKAELLAAVIAMGGHPEPLDQRSTRFYISVYGDTIVMGHSDAQNQAVSHVWVKQQGKWKMASWTSIRPPRHSSKSPSVRDDICAGHTRRLDAQMFTVPRWRHKAAR